MIVVLWRLVCSKLLWTFDSLAVAVCGEIHIPHNIGPHTCVFYIELRLWFTVTVSQNDDLHIYIYIYTFRFDLEMLCIHLFLSS